MFEMSTTSKEGAIALMKVEKFITQIRGNPLVDQSLINHRAIGKQKLESILSKKKNSSGQYCAVLVGSSVWAINDNSDNDYIVFSEEGTFEKPQSLVVDRDLIALNLNVLASIELHKFNQQNILYYMDLLLVSDESLSGNIDLAKNIRLSLIDYIEKNNQSKRFWKKLLNHFNLYYKNWADLDQSPIALTPSKPIGESRKERYNDRLRIRSFQSRAPEKYSAAFEKVRENFTPPSFHEYLTAIHYAKGALKIRNNFIATPIL